jgi:hypothetical protein
MVSGCFVVTSFIMTSGFAMVRRRVLVVFGRFDVVLRCLL